MRQDNTPFKSFWMGGYECADHLNAFGHRVNLLSATGHPDRLLEDYQQLAATGICTVREGIQWSIAEPVPYQYNWSLVDRMIKTAQQTGIQIVWDICHFGFANDLTPLHPMFARRFAHLCRAFVQHYRSRKPEGSLVITPINEVSFLSWLGGDVRGTAPYTSGQGWDVKYHLMKAYIEGVEAALATDPSVRILTTEPLVHVLPGNPENQDSCQQAAKLHEEQFQVLDMLGGSICPELRGQPEYLDILGFNYYHNNQWRDNDTREMVPWHPEKTHPDWRDLNCLMEEAWSRYHRPMVLSETSHALDSRPEWLTMIGEECVRILQKEIPLMGVCIYPILDRPDWDHTDQWHRSGLWDIPNPETLERVLHQPTVDALLAAQKRVAAVSEMVEL